MILSKRQLAAVRAKAFDEAAAMAGSCSCAAALRAQAAEIRRDADASRRGVTMIQMTIIVAIAGIMAVGCTSGRW